MRFLSLKCDAFFAAKRNIAMANCKNIKLKLDQVFTCNLSTQI